MSARDRLTRRSSHRERVLTALEEHQHVYDIAKATRIGIGRIYPVLYRLEKEGVVVSGWTDDVPRLRWYRLADPPAGVRV